MTDLVDDAALSAELDALAARLMTLKSGRAVMVAPVGAGSGASTIAAALCEAAARIDPGVWLFDLDFARNVQASRSALNGAAYSGELAGERFWRAEPRGVSRLALRKREDSPVLVSVFQREAGRLKRVTFQRSPGYWDEARKSCRLAVIDAPHGSPAINAIAPDMDGVILVADARRDRRSEAERAARNIETAGGAVMGVVINRSAVREPSLEPSASASTAAAAKNAARGAG